MGRRQAIAVGVYVCLAAAALTLAGACTSSPSPGASADAGGSNGGNDATVTPTNEDAGHASGVDAGTDGGPREAAASDDASDGAPPIDAFAPPEAGPDGEAPDASPPAPDAAPDAGITDACTTCMAASCSGSFTGLECSASSCDDTYPTCEGDPDCTEILSCWSGCGSSDTSCQDACAAGHSTGISQAFLLDDCAGRGCASSCTWAAALPGCYECLFSMAPADSNACFADAACVTYTTCVIQCGMDYSCFEACGDGDANAQAELGDLQGTCANYCQVL